MRARITDREIVYSGYVTVSKNRIEAGGQAVDREIVDQRDAAAVLPFDPERKTAVLVKLLRAPTLLRGFHDELIEAPAGVIDPGEDAGETARREAEEETGLVLGELEHVATAWTTPGVCAERVALFLAPYAAADRKGDGGGVEGENENITVVEMPLRRLAALADNGGIADMKTLALVFALRLRRPNLFEPA